MRCSRPTVRRAAWFAIVVCAPCLLGASCGAYKPDAELAAARQAIVDARARGAGERCPDMLRAAEARLAASNAAMAESKYDEALVAAQDAQITAIKARNCRGDASDYGAPRHRR
ncbi:hypothetical protein K8I61_06045 [bacterium]|nr:hypothetical protein [bacterium]